MVIHVYIDIVCNVELGIGDFCCFYYFDSTPSHTNLIWNMGFSLKFTWSWLVVLRNTFHGSRQVWGKGDEKITLLRTIFITCWSIIVRLSYHCHNGFSLSLIVTTDLHLMDFLEQVCRAGMYKLDSLIPGLLQSGIWASGFSKKKLCRTSRFTSILVN